MRTRVIGIGNPLRGDDGVGPAVVEMLEGLAMPPDVDLIDGGEAGLGLVGLMEGADRVVLIDAAEMREEPGVCRLFDLSEVLIDDDDPGCSIHHARTGSALRMANALGCLPPEVKIVGVQPKRMDWGVGLSSEVSRGLPLILSTVLETLSPTQGDCIRKE